MTETIVALLAAIGLVIGQGLIISWYQIRRMKR